MWRSRTRCCYACCIAPVFWRGLCLAHLGRLYLCILKGETTWTRAQVEHRCTKREHVLCERGRRDMLDAAWAFCLHLGGSICAREREKDGLCGEHHSYWETRNVTFRQLAAAGMARVSSAGRPHKQRTNARRPTSNGGGTPRNTHTGRGRPRRHALLDSARAWLADARRHRPRAKRSREATAETRQPG